MQATLGLLSERKGLGALNNASPMFCNSHCLPTNPGDGKGQLLAEGPGGVDVDESCVAWINQSMQNHIVELSYAQAWAKLRCISCTAL